jgi:hypothetical protein
VVDASAIMGVIFIAIRKRDFSSVKAGAFQRLHHCVNLEVVDRPVVAQSTTLIKLSYTSI